MHVKFLLGLALVCLLAACASLSHKNTTAEKSLTDFQKKAARFNNVLALPEFETTPAGVMAGVTNAITAANTALDGVGKLAPGEVTFDNTVRALDDITWRASTTANRLALIKETSTNAAVRDAATDAIKVYQEWAVGLDYREDVYRAVEAYADTKPKLTGEDAKLLDETMRDYRRAGLALPKAERDEVERLRKELEKLSTDFDSNITKAEKPLKFAKADLDGVPESFLSQKGVKTGDDEYTVMANVTWHYVTVMENARKEATRKRLEFERFNLAREQNVPLMQKILVLRDDIAKKLGYKSWADYRIEVRMAKDAKTAMDFEERLQKGLHSKFHAELAEFRKLKVAETGDPNAQIHRWDWRYYANQLKKAKYNVDAEQLRVYFPMQRVLDGMFTIYQKIFGLKFERVGPPYKWIGDLQLWAVSDAQTGEPLGCFYLDLFPREGKYNHFAVFEIIGGKLLPDGKYQRPVVAMVCNFPPPQPDKPSLLQHNDVETIFHEFGHVMHNLLTRAKYGRFAGSNVPRDFVEAPSQMLEAWIWDKKVLDSFAADYRDSSKKIPPEILSQLKAAKYAIYGCWYRRQLSFGLTDLALHTRIHKGNAQDALRLSNEILSDVFLSVPPDTAFIAYFGHFTGYDAGYYGYAWADAIAADMATVFEKAPDGYFDATVGRKLRDEIYAVGDLRDVNVSIEKFLGRPRSIEPFLKKIGVSSSAGVADAKDGARNFWTTTTNITGDIATKVSERRDKDGKVVVRIETVYRGKTKILGILHSRNAQGLMTTTRGYEVGGDLVVVESDEDGDGVFETVVVHAPDRSDIEVFRRQADGSVKPVGTAELGVIKKMYALQSDVGQVLGNYMEGKIDMDKVVEEAQQIREKGERLEERRRQLEKEGAK